MNRREQKAFVKDLCNSIAKGICENIKQHKIPQEWDGWELRYLIAEHANNSVYKMEGKRLRDYKDVVLCENL